MKKMHLIEGMGIRVKRVCVVIVFLAGLFGLRAFGADPATLFSKVDLNDAKMAGVKVLYDAGQYDEALALWRDNLMADLRATPLGEFGWHTSYTGAKYTAFPDLVVGYMTQAEYDAYLLSVDREWIQDAWGLTGAPGTVSNFNWLAVPPDTLSADALSCYHNPFVPFTVQYWSLEDPAYAQKFFEITGDFCARCYDLINPLSLTVKRANYPDLSWNTDALSALNQAWRVKNIIKCMGVIAKSVPGGTRPSTWLDILDARADVLSAGAYDVADQGLVADIAISMVEDHSYALLSRYLNPGAVPNQRFSGLYALLLTSRYFGEFSRTKTSITGQADGAMLDFVQTMMYPDGGMLEASLNYNESDVVGMEDLLAVYSGQTKSWRTLMDSRVEAFWDMEWALRLPTYGVAQIGNKYIDKPTEVWRNTSTRDAWIQTQTNRYPTSDAFRQSLNDFYGGASTNPPAFTSVAFPYAGYYVQRSGWSISDAAMYFMGGRPQRGHYMCDVNGVQLSAFGRDLLVAGGTPTYGFTLPAGVDASVETYLDENSSTKVNVILVDGKSQNKGTLAQSVYSTPINATWHTSGHFDVVEGLHSQGFGAEMDVQHKRRAIYARDAGLWVLIDDMISTDGSSHSYRQVWNFMPYKTDSGTAVYGFKENEVVIDQANKAIYTVDADTADTPNVWLHSFGQNVTLQKYYGNVSPTYGWYARGFGDAIPAVDVHTVFSGSGNRQLVTLIKPVEGLTNGYASLVDLGTGAVKGFDCTTDDGQVISLRSAQQSGATLTVGGISAQAGALLVYTSNTVVRGVVFDAQTFASGNVFREGLSGNSFEFEVAGDANVIMHKMQVPQSFDWKGTGADIAPSYGFRPSACGGPDQFVPDIDGNGSESITLDGSGSIDTDGVIVSYVWKEGSTQIATGVSPTVILSTGPHTITLTVTDDEAYTGQDTVFVGVSSAPQVENVIASVVDQSSALAKGMLTSGAAAEAWICWGATDGGTFSTSAWDNVISLGTVSEGVAFSSLVAGLSTNTTYFYRCYATNAVGSDWSDTAATLSGTPVVGFPWTPVVLPSIAVWYDASDASTITASGGAVSQWRDKSGNNNHAVQATGSKQPTLNGDRIVFAGGATGQGLDTTSTVNWGANYEYDLFAAFDYTALQTADGSLGTIVGYGNVTSSPGNIFARSDAYNVGGYYYSTSLGITNAYQGTMLGHLRIKDNGANLLGRICINGNYTEPTVTASKGATATSLHIGAVNGANYRCFNGAVREVIYLDYTASGADRQKIEGYLAHKWGLTANLPSDHPYKTIPPVGSGTIANLSPTGISDSAATFNASLNAMGTNYNVTVYYGTSDGGTNAGSWAASAAVGSWTNVSTNVSYSLSSLLDGTSYSYTFMMSNAAGVVWGTPSWSFTTSGGFQLPVVAIGVAGNITDTSALLPGELLSTGAAPTTVWCYWNPDSDPQADVSGWQYSRSFGVASGPQMYTNNTADTVALTPDTRYYYRYAAVNSYGTNWSATGSFDTFGPPQVENAGGGESASETSAMLHGALTAGGSAETWICWGATDGGTVSTSAWANVVAMGAVTEGVAFSNLVAGLSTNTTYFYRCYAENAYGSDWSDTATAFSGTPVGGGTPWTPADVDTTAWYDAADASTVLKNGSAVTNWLDKSGNARHAVQATALRQPTYTANNPMVNNLPSIGNISSSGSIGLTTPSFGAKTAYVVTYYKDGADATFDVYSTLLSGPSQYGQTRVMGDINTANLYNVYNLNDAGTYKNGSTTNSLTVLPMPASILKLKGSTTYTQVWSLGFNQSDSNRDWQGAYSEIIFTDGTEDLATQQKLEGYLAHKWGLTANLPSGHPYKSAPPGGAGAIANLSPTGISDSAATFNASLNAMGTNYNVTVYYGTSDGGTNATSWAASAAVGSWTNVMTNSSYVASGLLSGTTYYYTFMASNATTNVWASPSWTFTTLGTAQSPTVTVNHLVPHVWLLARNALWSGDYEAAVLADQDGDGFTTWEEYWSGTDPVNSNSFLRIDSVTLEGGNAVLKWQHAAVDAGLPALTIQTTTNLQLGSWVYTGQKSPVNGTNSWSGAALPQQLFYRLAVTNAP